MSGSEFFAMGQYGFYVWTAYGLAAVILIANVLLPLRRRRTVQRQLAEFYRMQKDSR
jgi:heme exporter protein D